MLEFKNVTEKKYIDIFLSTLPYDVLIKPFKKNTNLQKKLAGFRLIESASPPKKIIPILREEILKGNIEEEMFIKEWEKIYADLVRQIQPLTLEKIEEKVPELLSLYKPEVIFSALLFSKDESYKKILQDLLDVIEGEKEKIEKNIEGQEAIDKSVKINKKLLKEIEKLRKKLILQEKKNIMEIERLTEKIKEQEGEILNYKNKISQLEKEKEMLEERIEKIGLEFEKRMNKIIENASSKERQAENLKILVNRLLVEIQQQKIDFNNALLEIKEILSNIEEKTNFLFDNTVAQLAVTKEEQEYSLVEDLSRMLKIID